MRQWKLLGFNSILQSTVQQYKYTSLLQCDPEVCVVYLMVFLRAFSRAFKILWSAGEVRFPGLMSSALSRAESAEIERSALGDDGGMDEESVTGGEGFSTATIFTASIPASPVISGSGSDGDGLEATTEGPEIARLGGGVGMALGGLGMISFWLAGLEMDRAGVSISSGVSLSGAWISGIKAGGGV